MARLSFLENILLIQILIIFPIIIKFPPLRKAAERYVQAKDHMSKNHDIETYSKLAEGAKFFLDESFKYINEALISEAAGEIFSELIQKIEPTENDNEIMKNALIPNTPIELLQSEDLNVLSEETHSKFRLAWGKANILANTKKHIFKSDHRVVSIELLGHLNNLGFFIETLTNRHLLFLHQSRSIDDFSYSRISMAKIMERLIFIFKDDLKNGKFQLTEITYLFTLRNKTVHYTPDNAIALKPRLSELIQIWKQCKEIIEKFEEVEKINEELFSEIIDSYFESFNAKWIKK